MNKFRIKLKEMKLKELLSIEKGKKINDTARFLNLQKNKI